MLDALHFFFGRFVCDYIQVLIKLCFIFQKNVTLSGMLKNEGKKNKQKLKTCIASALMICAFLPDVISHSAS